MSTRQRENRNNGNQESSSKEASEEGSQENSKEEVSKQRNRQHNRGTPKASPEVFLVKANSSVFMRLQRTLRAIGKFAEGARVEVAPASISPDGNPAQLISVFSLFPISRLVRVGHLTEGGGKTMGRERGRSRALGFLPEKSGAPLTKVVLGHATFR